MVLWARVVVLNTTVGFAITVTLVVEIEGIVQVGLSGWAVNVKVKVPDSVEVDT